MDNGNSIVHFFTCILQKFQRTNSKLQTKTEISNIRFQIEAFWDLKFDIFLRFEIWLLELL